MFSGKSFEDLDLKNQEMQILFFQNKFCLSIESCNYFVSVAPDFQSNDSVELTSTVSDFSFTRCTPLTYAL